MKILTRDEFKQLLNDNPNKRFLFLEWVPSVYTSDFHISDGDPKHPGFGALTMAPDGEDFIVDYDWNIDEYLSDDKFAVLSENEILQLIYAFRLCVTKREKETAFHCKAEESRWRDILACNDCPNKCEEWYQWDKEMKK
jgi:hypothetical protein